MCWAESPTQRVDENAAVALAIAKSNGWGLFLFPTVLSWFRGAAVLLQELPQIPPVNLSFDC